MTSHANELKSRTLRALKWSALSEMAQRLITPIAFLLLARLLTPTDFGVAAAALVVLSFAQVFWDAGLGRALVQRERDIDKAADVVFWSNLGLAGSVYVVLFLSAGLIGGHLFKDPRVAAVIRVQGLTVLVNAFACVQTVQYQRNLDFKTLFWVRLVTTGVPAVATLPLAACGFGYWSLVIGSLTGAVVQAVALWRYSPWRPRLEYDLRVAREMIQFGVWVTASGMLAWLYLWGDNLLVGAFFDSQTLGLYRTGSTFVLSVFGLAIGSITSVVYPMLARMQADMGRFREAVLRIMRLIFLIAAPLGAMLFITRGATAAALFGAKWIGVEDIIGWYALFTGLAWLVGANNQFYRAAGRPKWETNVMLFALATNIPVYLWSLSRGLDVFLKARLFLVLIDITLHLIILSHILKIKTRDVLFQIRHIAFGFCAMLGVSLCVCRWTSYSPVTQGLIAAPLACVMFWGIALGPGSSNFKELAGLLKALGKAKNPALSLIVR